MSQAMARIAILLGTTFLSGCMVIAGRDKGEQFFTKAQVENIQLGKTTKEEVLQWFGPPLAVARRGEGGKVPPGEDARTDTFFELFSSKHSITEDHVIYYYRNIGSREVGAVVLFAGGARRETVRDRLWILINGGTGIVEDYVFKEDK